MNETPEQNKEEQHGRCVNWGFVPQRRAPRLRFHVLKSQLIHQFGGARLSIETGLRAV
jgi:hypothetical protein